MSIRNWLFIGIIVVIGVIIFIAQSNVPRIDNLTEGQVIEASVNELQTPNRIKFPENMAKEKDDDFLVLDVPSPNVSDEGNAGVGAADRIVVDMDGLEDDASVLEEAPTGYDAWISRADEQIAELQSSCQGGLLTIYLQYIAASEKAEKQKLITQGKAELARCDASFDGIMNNLEDTLTSNQLPTTVINTYRSEYKKQKALAQSMLE